MGYFDNSTSIIGGGVTALIGIVIICALFILGLRRFHKKNGRYSYGIIKDENEDVDGHISISKFSQELQVVIVMMLVMVMIRLMKQ